jgi:pSer/pThr/pTyr-binding forkhead associated (FHA) protein
MKAKLVLISPEADAREFKLALPVKIGRGQEAKLKLVHPLVSRVHCEIYEQDDQLMVRDMASLNGTFVDDERVADEMALPSGCRLTVGSAQFHVLYGADYDRPLPTQKAIQSDAPTTRPDETVPMAPAASMAGTDESDDPWNLAESKSNQGGSHEDTRTLDFDFLADDEPPKTAPAPKPAAANPTAKANAPAKAAAPAQPAAAKAAAPAKPATPPGFPVRPPNPAEFADDDEPGVKPFTAKGPSPAKTGPAAPVPAAPANDSDEIPAGPAEEPGGGDEDADLDDFFKSIM